MQRSSHEVQIAGLIAFLTSGIVVSGLVSVIFGGIISWTEASLIAVTVITLLSGVYYFSLANRRVQQLADNLDAVTVQYVEEIYREHEDSFRGIFYTELERVVRRAKKEILAYGCTYVEGGEFIPDQATHSSRKRYLEAIEETIKKNLGTGFRYVRLCNISRNDPVATASHYLDRESLDHCRRILEIQHKHDEKNEEGHPIILSILKVPTELLISFMVVDSEYIVVELNGIDVYGKAYAAGMFFLRDRLGSTAERFKRHFERMVEVAKKVRSEELAIQDRSPFSK